MSNVTLLEIANATAAEFGTTLPAMRERYPRTGSRPAPAVRARNVAMWLALRHTSKARSEVRRFFGRSDDSSARAGIREINERRELEPELAAHIEAIEREIDRIHEARIDAVSAPQIEEARPVA